MVTTIKLGPERPRYEPWLRFSEEVEECALDLIEDSSTSPEEAKKLALLVGGSIPARKRRNRIIRALKSAEALADRGRAREGARLLRSALLEVLY